MSNDEIRNFCKAYKALEKKGTYPWQILDEALFYVCNEYPKHKTTDEVFSKVALVNRAYRTNLHFAGKKNIETRIAETLVNNNLDAALAPLRTMRSLVTENLSAVVEVHGQIVTIVKKVTKKINNSFVSKYMHFHFPDIVPIFDQYAYDESWRLKPLQKSEWLKWDDLINCEYGYHCESVVNLLNELRANGVNSPNLKLIDILLYEGNG